MPRKAPADEHSIIYVRVPPEDKRRLRELADREFAGSMAACFRYLLDTFTAGRTAQAKSLAGFEEADGIRRRVDNLVGADLDED